MTIDWQAFTPWSALIGGLLIGSAAVMLIRFNGRIAGISGIVGGLLMPSQPKAEAVWRLAFLAGLASAHCVPLLPRCYLWRVALQRYGFHVTSWGGKR